MEESGFLDRLLSSETEGVVVSDGSHRVTRVNPRFLSMFGLAEQEIMGQNIDGLIVPPQLAAEATEVSEAVSSGKPVSMETIRVRSDGTPLIVSIIASLSAGDDDSCSHYAIYRELPHQADRKRRKGEKPDSEVLTALFSDAGEPGILTDSGGFVRSVNHSFSRHFGWKSEELTGRTVTETLVPEDGAGKEEELLDLISFGSILRTDTVLLDAYGTRRRAGLVASPVSMEDGSIGSYRVYCPVELPTPDLLDARGKNRFKQPPFKHLPGIFFRVRNDEQRTVEFATRETIPAPGTMGSDFLPMDNGLSAMVHPGDRDNLRTILRASAESGAPYQSTYRIITPSGERWVLEQGCPVDGSTGFEGYIVDITASKRIEEMVSRARKRLEDLHKVAGKLQRSATEAEVHRICSEAACTLLDADCGMVVNNLEHGMEVSFQVSSPPDGFCPGNCHFEIARMVIETGRQFSYSSRDIHATECPLASNGVCRPLADRSVFLALSSRSEAFTESLVGITDLLLGYAEQALRRIALQRRLIDQAIHDPLTGVYNRNHFNRLAELEESRARRDGTTLGFIMVDIDNFKEINDTRGHQTGDTVLREVAAVLSRAVRKTDTVIRYGGDEFLIILSRVDSMTEMVEARIRKMLLKEVSPGFTVTVSMGHSQWNAGSGSSIDEAISRADRMMYEEKRNRGKL